MALSNGIVSYWKLDETSGAAADSAGVYSLGNTGSVTYAPSKINNGAVFSNNTGQVLTATSLPFGAAGSIALWVFINSGDDGGYFFDSSNGNRFLFLYDSVGAGVIQLNGVAGPAITSGAIPFNQFVHLALTWDSALGVNKMALYINGALYSNANNNVAAVTPANFFVGNRFTNTGTQDSMNGRIDEMGTWSRALTALEAAQLYNLGNGTQYPFGPSVTTQAVTLIGPTSATGNGTVVSDNGFTVTERGIVFATTPGPTTANSKVSVAGTTGAFTAPMSGLSAGSTYYVRAYAISSQGTGYGSEVSFTARTVPPRTAYKNIGGVAGTGYAVRMTVGGTVGSVTVSLGSTGTSVTIPAGTGVYAFSGVYQGINGLTILANTGFNGTIDDLQYVVLVAGADYNTINWSLATFTSLIPISSSVVFKRLEDNEFNRFRTFRYLDLLFRNLSAYVTVTIREEHSNNVSTKTKTFLVGNTGDPVSPYVKKKISFLSKNQAILIGISNANLNDSFTLAQFELEGIQVPSKLFQAASIISVT